MNKAHLIGYIGNFGNQQIITGGQIVKSKEIFDALSYRYKNEVKKINTGNWKKHPYDTFKECVYLSKNCSNIIFLPAQNGIRVFGPLLLHYKKIYNFKLHYIVIGAWLPNLAQKNKAILKMLKKIDYLYVETLLMKEQLEKIGLTNIVKMNNFKQLNILKEPVKYNDKILKVCIFSRIEEKKGITDAIKTIAKYNKYNNTTYHLDIYGPIEHEYKNEFKNLIDKYKRDITYKGIVNYNESVDILKKYYCLLFPTKYTTEGIPGTIIDAYASGLPVIASRWDNYNEIIIENETGLTYEMNDIDEFYGLLGKADANREMLNNMRNRCIDKAEEYTIQFNISKLIDRI